jgi:predicted Rossmann fold nucleotide-binding protein DprA/Smf involved in DNA uptake
MTDTSPDRSSPDSTRAALLLTNRLVPLDAAPMTAREFWQLVERVDPADLLRDDVAAIASHADVDHDEAVRLRTLLDAATALTFEQERLHDNGISLVSALDARFPSALRSRLGAACPPFLLVAGPMEWLGRSGLGIVGSRDATGGLLDVARRAAELAVGHAWAVVSGLARGVDQASMAGALDAGGRVIGVPAEGITRAARSAEVRGRVHAGELCIASPYAPDAPFRAGNAMGRNKIVYALSQVTFVVSADAGSGGTWAGAEEALERRYARVAVWVGDGAEAGNHALATRGAVPITDLTTLFDIDPAIPPPPQTSLF